MTVESPTEDFDWSVLCENHCDPTMTKQYLCGFVGCNKSYTNRQNAYRHRKTHFEDMSTKASIADDSVLRKIEAANLQRERELLIESFSFSFEQYGEEQATAAMRSNKKLKDHVVPLRKIMEADIAKLLRDAQESGSIVERQLSDFKDAIPKDASDQLAALEVVIDVFRKATSRKLCHLLLFTWRITPRLRQSRALKGVLDELFTEALNDLAPNTSPKDGNKRKAEMLDATVSQEAPISDRLNGSELVTIGVSVPATNGNGSAKKKKPRFEFLDNFLIDDDEEDLQRIDESVDKDR